MGGIGPSDVYDLAALLVSELAHLHAQKTNALPPRRTFYPGRKLPSHVFQRVGVLSRQIDAIREMAEANPNWLTE